MRLRLFVSASVMALLAVSGTSLFAQEKELLVGTWKLNMEKSKNDPPPQGARPQSVVRTFEDRGGGVLVATTETINADGKKGLVVVVFKRDGKPYPIATTGSGPSLPMMAFKKVDAHNNEHTTTVDGKVVNTGTEKISADGKIYTEERKGTNAQGKPFDNIGVWDRQ
jgi:hypothetical protein